ncbi:MAG: hypothetical protein OXN18_15680 [Gemmatimonadota bacterium]|nr:hypothetical protein [Gemmatimonadota bacterium]
MYRTAVVLAALAVAACDLTRPSTSETWQGPATIHDSEPTAQAMSADTTGPTTYVWVNYDRLEGESEIVGIVAIGSQNEPGVPAGADCPLRFLLDRGQCYITTAARGVAVPFDNPRFRALVFQLPNVGTCEMGGHITTDSVTTWHAWTYCQDGRLLLTATLVEATDG